MESLMYSRIRGETQGIYLGTGKLLGIDSISIQNNFGSNTLRYLGRGNRNEFQIPNSEQSTDVSINSTLINSEPFISLTGKDGINLFILKDKNNINKNYCLLSGYLTSYSAKFGINQIPQISTSLKFYKNSGPFSIPNLDSISAAQLSGIQSNNYDLIPSGLEIPHDDSLNLTLDEYKTNRVQEFNININVNRIPINNGGGRSPKRVDIIYPLNAKCSFSFEGGDYTGFRLTDVPQYNKTQNISLQVNGQTGANIVTYSFNNMTMVNENISQTVDNSQLITREYQGYINGPPPQIEFADNISSGLYLAIRDDGQVGTGTYVNPYQANTQELFDQYMNSAPAGKHIYLSKGTFQTSGYKQNLVGGGYAKSGWHVIGMGIDKTVVQIVKARNYGGSHWCFGLDYNQYAHNSIWKDFTLDCNLLGQIDNTGINIGGISLGGQNTLFKNLKAINWGTRMDSECFVLSAGGNDVTYNTDFTGATIDSCIVVQPAPYSNQNVSSLISCGAGGSIDTNDLSGTHVNPTVRNCICDGGSASRGNPSQGVFTIGKNGLIENNYFSNMGSAFYTDTARNASVTIRNNQMINVQRGVQFSLYSTTSTLGTGYFLNNLVELTADTPVGDVNAFRFLGRDPGITFPPPYTIGYIVISGNTINYNCSNYSKSGAISLMVGLHNVGTGIIIDNLSSLYDDDDPLFHKQIITGDYSKSMTLTNNRSSLTNTLITGSNAL